jgi:transcriptional regulator with GAF, ATPase, and Fis domain
MLGIQAHGYQGDVDESPAEEEKEQPGQLQELFRLPISEARKQFRTLYLENILLTNENDLKRAAKMMGLTEKGLKSMIKRHDIAKRPY